MTTSHHGRDQIVYVTLGGQAATARSPGCKVRDLSTSAPTTQLLTPFIPELGFPVAGAATRSPRSTSTSPGSSPTRCATDAIRGAGPAGGHVLDRADHGQARARAGHGPARAAAEELHPARRSSRTRPRWGSSTTRATTTGSLDRLLENFDLDAFRREQAELREKGIHRGVGFSTYVEVCGLAPSRAVGPQGVGLQAAFWESAMVRVHPYRLGHGVHRHRRRTARASTRSFAQIAADRLGIEPENVDVIHGDTDQGPFGLGHLRLALALGGRRGGRPRRREGAGEGQEDLRRAAGGGARGHRAGRRQVPGARLAGQVDDDGRDLRARRTSRRNELPADIEPGLEETSFYDPENFVFPFGAHACVVDVDVETGKVEVVRYVAVDDCGPAINPMLIDGQIHGGIVARDRPGAVRAGRLRRGGPARHRHVRGLRAADRGRAPERSRPTAPRRRRRSTRWASRASARRARSPPRPRSPPRSSTRCGRSASTGSTCRSRPMRVWQAIQGGGLRRRRGAPSRAATSASTAGRGRLRPSAPEEGGAR